MTLNRRSPASARKLQNRTAQREFRQRKLQYVKDLEARVEFLSSPRDDQLEILKALLHGASSVRVTGTVAEELVCSC